MIDTRELAPDITQLIGRSPGAQPREKAIASIKARRAKLLTRPPPDSPPHPAAEEMAVTEREPLPTLDDTEAFAAGFWQRLKGKEAAKKERPPRGSKPRLVVDNDEPVPPERT